MKIALFVLCFLGGSVALPNKESRRELCSPDHMFMCKDGSCVPLDTRCDGKADCYDGSDECGCKDSECGEGMFSCDDGDTCIVNDWKCDGIKDCNDDSDEEDCPATTPGPTYGPVVCAADEFMCANGEKCIYDNWKCDDYQDCSDNSDEQDCPTPTPGPSQGPVQCTADEFMCANGEKCIYDYWKCDNYQDCYDNSDEQDCPTPTPGPSQGPTPTSGPVQCTADEFMCANGEKCIYDYWKCDNYQDCSDNSDEQDCPTTQAPTQAPTQPPAACDSDLNKCDGFADCTDGSDENPEMCTTFTCPAGYGKCGDGKTCISDSAICDGYQDCLDGSDEAQCKDHACTASEYKCPDSFCLKTSNGNGKCNGVPECPNGEDEQGCAGVARGLLRGMQIRRLEYLLDELNMRSKHSGRNKRSHAHQAMEAMRTETARKFMAVYNHGKERSRTLHSQLIGSARRKDSRRNSRISHMETHRRRSNLPVRRRQYSQVRRTERLRQRSDNRIRNMKMHGRRR